MTQGEKAEFLREIAEEMLADFAEGDPLAGHWPEGWLHRKADQLEGLIEP